MLDQQDSNHDENGADEQTRDMDESDATGPGDVDDMLTVRNLEKSFGPVTVLEDVSLSVPAGSFVAVIGPNGSGKTTLLRTIVDDLSPTAGTIEYRGPSVPREIGYLPQRPTFRPGFTALETVSFYRSLVGGTDPKRLLERVGLENAADRRVEALSGGMHRLLGIAQAMVGDPPVVILDEPASGLDPNMSRLVFDAASEFAAAGNGVVVSSHDLSLVAETADVVVLLAAGRVVESGTPGTVTDRLGVSTLRGAIESVAGAESRVTVVGEESE
ncbi:MAG: ABC transporter ATP-binding protein [Natronomonas sp.]